MPHPRRVSIAAPLTFLVACACAPRAPEGPPEPSSGERRVQSGRDVYVVREEGSMAEAEIDAPLPRVWTALRGTYEAMDIPVRTFEPAEGRLASPAFRATSIAGRRMSRWLDCGRGVSQPRADSYDVHLTVTSTVRPARGERTRLFTAVDATARPRSVSGSEVRCSSSGRLEEAIAAGVRERAGGAADPEGAVH